MEHRCVDLAVADPPYGINWPGYDKYRDNLRGAAFTKWCATWFAQLHRVLRPHGSFWLAIGDEHVSELDVLAKERFGFYKRSHVIWTYSFGVACSKNFSRSHTHWLYFTKHKTKFHFDTEAIRVPSARQLKYNDKRGNPKGKLPDNTWVLHPDKLAECFQPSRDTWLESRICGTFKERQHRGETGKRKTVPQMPIGIMERIVLACSKPGDLVLDPFLGTGTTGVAAVMHGRNFWGCDLSRNYVRQSNKRIEEAVKC